MKIQVKALAIMLSMGLILATGCGKASENIASNNNENDSVYANTKTYDANIINLNVDNATLNGTAIEEYDYTWHCDPSVAHDEVKNAPAEYYTGTEPDTDAAAYIDHELYYFPKLDEASFKQITYDGEREWAYYYNDGANDEFIFATLPCLGSNIPTQMMHSDEEAAENKVLHITKAGTYVLTGSWKGQIKVDLGDEAYENEAEKVTLILNGADIECSVAPGIIMYNVYECDNAWEDTERTDAYVNTDDAGATIIIADDSQNHISGQNVYRMLKTKYKDDSSTDTVKLQKKMRKTDGALYSYMTMNIDGEETGNGKLTVESGFEGIDSELHLTVKGGNITIYSQDDGMNVNEDHVSVISFLGGTTTINAALGQEGDGVDSNGYIMLDGGTVIVNGIRVPDSALDSEDGIYYNSGKIIEDNVEQSFTRGEIIKETRGGAGEHGPGPRDDMQKPGMPRPDMPNGKTPLGRG